MKKDPKINQGFFHRLKLQGPVKGLFGTSLVEQAGAPGAELSGSRKNFKKFQEKFMENSQFI